MLNIPSVILEMEEYRKKILTHVEPVNETAESKKLSADKAKEASKIIESMKTLGNENFSTVKGRVVHAFTWVFETFGYDEFKRLAIKLKKIDTLTNEEYIEAKGELAELVLYITIKEWLRVTGKTEAEWRVYHHFWLPYVSGRGHTEIDVILVSRFIVVVFECKSYNGLKKVGKECYLTPARGKAIDVFGQNAHHCKALWEHLEPMAVTDVGIMKSVMFNFSIGEIEDGRTFDNKRRMPILDENNVVHFLKAMDREVSRVGWRSGIFDFFEEVAATPYDPEQHVSDMLN